MPSVSEVASLVGVALAVAILVQLLKLAAGAFAPELRDGPRRRVLFRALAVALGVGLAFLALAPDAVPGLHRGVVGVVCGGLSDVVYRLFRPWLSDRFQGRRGGRDG